MILALLLNKNLRDEILNESIFNSSLINLINKIKEEKKKINFESAKEEVKEKNIYLDFIHIVCVKTNEYWKDIESKDKEFMILYIDKGSIVRNLGKIGEELSDADVIGKFPILNGIDYKSNYANILLYIEV
jgi:hypothetical protein